MRTASFIPALLLVAAACGDPGTAPEGIPANAIVVDAGSIGELLGPFRWNSGLEHRDRMVVRDAVAWAELWNRMNGATGMNPPLEPPAVDFERYMVLVAAMGVRPSGGYEIIIESVHRAGDDLYVVVNERGHSRCPVTQALTQPLAGVLVPRTDGRVTFVERTSVHVCRP